MLTPDPLSPAVRELLECHRDLTRQIVALKRQADAIVEQLRRMDAGHRRPAAVLTPRERNPA